MVPYLTSQPMVRMARKSRPVLRVALRQGPPVRMPAGMLARTSCGWYRSGWTLARSISTIPSTRQCRSIEQRTESAQAPRTTLRSRSLLLLAALLTPAVSARAQYLQLFVTEPYLELHTGPGRGYPVFHVVGRGRQRRRAVRRTDWFKVRAEHGVVGWASQTRHAEDGAGRRLAVQVRPGRPRRLHLAPLRDGHLRTAVRRRLLVSGYRAPLHQLATRRRGLRRQFLGKCLQRRRRSTSASRTSFVPASRAGRRL